MGRQIIKQPNGKYAVFSSSCDDFITINAPPEEIIADWQIDGILDAAAKVPEIIRELESGIKPLGFSYTWEDALELIKEIHGKEAVQKVLQQIEQGV